MFDLECVMMELKHLIILHVQDVSKQGGGGVMVWAATVTTVTLIPVRCESIIR